MSLDVTGFITWIRTFLDDVYAPKGSGGDITVDNALSTTSENPVQNKVVKSAIDGKANSSHTHGYIKNDGTLTTSNSGTHSYYLTVNSSDKIVKGKNLKTTALTHTSALSNIGTSADASQSAINNAINTKLGQVSTLDQCYPVGAIYMSVNDTNPSTLFGGTWEQLKDRFLLAAGDSYTNGATGGEANHTLNTNEIPGHSHLQHQWTMIVSAGGNTGTWQPTSKSGGVQCAIKDDRDRTTRITESAGGGQAHNNMPPYLVVYMWKRTA